MVYVTGLLGLGILLLAGDALVKGAVNLALRLGVPALIVSLTIVAFGTSAPELLISIKAALEGVPGIAMGNVVGSNTANVLMVLGIPALLAVMHTSSHDTRKSYWIMLASTFLFIALAFRGVFDWIAGLILVGVLALILGDAFRDSLKHRNGAMDAAEDEDDLEGADPNMPWWKVILFLALGLIGLPVGADLLVDSARIIAMRFGVSDTVIGLTLVAIGTSLPELATTVSAALRKQADVALGNVIGSNMFNLLAIIGVASLIAPIDVDAEFLRFDLWVMLAASLLLVPFVLMGRDLTRIWGVILTALYVAYVLYVLS
ncbi:MULTISPECIES: calcium/sodium antiporter [unclassified Roseivivax]|uniref:calcium/sodium antiporter n=1 Tax=unclassified Roseivivax TaxID=2639302 RepID=UPI001267C85D|nr:MULTISPECIES: calcium/sodium antiporter [unclassified Roseivivax]